MPERQNPDPSLAALTLFRPEPTHFDDEWGPGQRADTLTAILAGSSTAAKSPRSTRRRWVALSALTAAAAAIPVVLLLPADGPGGLEPAAAATLNSLSIAAGRAGGSVGPGQFAYLREDDDQLLIPGEAKPPLEPGERYVGNVLSDRQEQWTAPDGTVWFVEPLADGRSCLAMHGPDAGITPAGVIFDYEDLSTPELAELPTSPRQLADYIDAHPTGDNRGATNRFMVIGDLLRSQLAPPALRAAALQVLAHTPGLTVATDSYDAGGRPAIRIDYSYGHGTESLFFDANTSRVIEDKITADQSESSAEDWSIVREAKVVDSLPSGLPRCPAPQ